MLHAVADAGLRAQMDKIVGFEMRNEAGEFLRVGEIGLQKAKILSRREFREPGSLQGHVVVVVQVVHAQHLAALRFRQAPGDVVTDETGGAGYEDFHLARDRVTRAGRLAETAPADRKGRNRGRCGAHRGSACGRRSRKL